MGESKSKKTTETITVKKSAGISATNLNTSSERTASSVTYGPKQYRIVLVGLAVLVIGFILMSGGNMPNPDTWDENIIYGFRRTVAAPVFILAGLIVQIWAIFKV